MTEKIDIEAFRYYLASAYAAAQNGRSVQSLRKDYDPINRPNTIPIWHDAICSAQKMYMMEKVFANKDVKDWDKIGVQEGYGRSYFKTLESLYSLEMEKTND